MISRVKTALHHVYWQSHLDSDTPMRIELEVMSTMRRGNLFIESARHDWRILGLQSFSSPRKVLVNQQKNYFPILLQCTTCYPDLRYF